MTDWVKRVLGNEDAGGLKQFLQPVAEAWPLDEWVLGIVASRTKVILTDKVCVPAIEEKRLSVVIHHERHSASGWRRDEMLEAFDAIVARSACEAIAAWDC